MLSDDLAAKYVALGLCTAVGTDIILTTKGVLPRGAGPYVTIKDTGGTAPLRSHKSRARRPEAQIVVQAATASAARNKAVALHAVYCDGIYNATVGGNRYAAITVVQDVMDLGVAATGRPRFGFNVSAVESGAS